MSHQQELLALPLVAAAAQPCTAAYIRIELRRRSTRSRSAGRRRLPAIAPRGYASGYDDMHKVWLSVTPIDMRAGADTPLARVVAVFGCAYPHHPVRVHQSAWQPDQFKAMVIGLPWQRIGTQSAFALV